VSGAPKRHSDNTPNVASSAASGAPAPKLSTGTIQEHREQVRESVEMPVAVSEVRFPADRPVEWPYLSESDLAAIVKTMKMRAHNFRRAAGGLDQKLPKRKSRNLRITVTDTVGSLLIFGLKPDALVPKIKAPTKFSIPPNPHKPVRGRRKR
jgi:hypothetical protein